MEVNFFGVLALTRRLLPAFRARRYGRIVIISSEAAFAGQPAISPYCASKWAIEGWAEALCYELEPFNIQIILIEPGLTVGHRKADPNTRYTKAEMIEWCASWIKIYDKLPQNTSFM